MELQSAIKLLVLGLALSLVVAGEEDIEGVTYNTTAYTLSEPQPALFAVGDDDLQVKVNGCFHRNNLNCCFHQSRLLNLEGERLCSDFGATNCCFMLPGRDQHPRLPRDLVPLLPTLTSHGQCEQRRKGRRVLHCCRGATPESPNPSGRAARVCSTVGNMMCCYYPFAGHLLELTATGSKDGFSAEFVFKAENPEGIAGDRRAYLAKQA